MYGLKQLTVLSLMLLSVTAKEAAKSTMVGVPPILVVGMFNFRASYVLTEVSGWHRD